MKRILEGLKIISKYEPDTDFCAEHDEIFVGDSNYYSEEDLNKMEELGWSWDESLDSWHHFT